MSLTWVSGLWRKPTYLVHTSIPPYLHNASLGSKNPHGPADHDDRTFKQWVSARDFADVTTTPGDWDVPCVEMAALAATEVRATVGFPKGPVSLDGVEIVFEVNGAETGIIILALSVLSCKGGKNAVLPTITLNPVIIPPPAAQQPVNVTLMSFEKNVDVTDEWVFITVRRDSTDPRDNFPPIDFLGVLLTWTVDQ